MGQNDWHPSSPGSMPHSGPLFHGAESMMIGAFMSELRMGQSQTIAALDRQTVVLERILEHQQAHQPAAPLPPAASAQSAPTTSSTEKLSIRDWLQIVFGIGLVVGALTGNLTWREVISIGGKPFGF